MILLRQNNQSLANVHNSSYSQVRTTAQILCGFSQVFPGSGEQSQTEVTDGPFVLVDMQGREGREFKDLPGSKTFICVDSH